MSRRGARQAPGEGALARGDERGVPAPLSPRAPSSFSSRPFPSARSSSFRAQAAAAYVLAQVPPQAQAPPKSDRVAERQPPIPLLRFSRASGSVSRAAASLLHSLSLLVFDAAVRRRKGEGVESPADARDGGQSLGRQGGDDQEQGGVRETAEVAEAEARVARRRGEPGPLLLLGRAALPPPPPPLAASATSTSPSQLASRLSLAKSSDPQGRIPRGCGAPGRTPRLSESSGAEVGTQAVGGISEATSRALFQLFDRRLVLFRLTTSRPAPSPFLSEFARSLVLFWFFPLSPLFLPLPSSLLAAFLHSLPPLAPKKRDTMVSAEEEQGTFRVPCKKRRLHFERVARALLRSRRRRRRR